jgi:RNA polymerase sigma-70 factor (ECF subfamily)
MVRSDDSSQVFNRLRPRLLGIACHMLDSTAEGEDVVQGAWLRWREAAHHVLDNAETWLVSVTVRLAVDRLREMKVQRDDCGCTRLPVPFVNGSPPSPDQLLENLENVSIAFLTLLERLTPEARAAFLMRKIVGADYAEVAAVLGRSKTDCRQLVHRARLQLQEKRVCFAISQETHYRLLRDFAAASERGDVVMLQSMLAEDAELIGYDGRKVSSFGRPLQGGGRIARLYFAIRRRHGSLLRTRFAPINGEWGLLRFIDGILESVESIETDGTRIVRIRVQRNPEKLALLASVLNSH